MENTFGDFWRTVWDQGVCVVVMVTNIVEGGRVCWPFIDQYHFNAGNAFQCLLMTTFLNIEDRWKEGMK